ncbi:MAG: endonuclease [Epsilonproteobacteria bacterium]|nr:MAG: endonuclease [Campylobacterota bacterium]
MKIRLATFNLFQFAEPPYSWYTKKNKFNQRQWIEKTTWIKSQILKMDCDIIGFQEVFSSDALEKLVHELGFNYFETVDSAKLSTNNPYKYMTTTVAIASKYPISNIQKVKVHTPSIKKHHLQGHFHFSRIPIKATIILPNDKELLVYVCHLKSNRLNAFEHVFNEHHSLEHKQEVVFKELEDKYSVSLKQRLCEASSLFFDIRKSKSKPTLLLCDLNDKEFSLTIDALSNNKYHDNRRKENYVLLDASYQYKKENYNPHPEEKETKRKSTSYFLGKGNVLDYIFISNHFDKNNKDRIAQVINYSILDTHLQDNKDGSLLTSDHAQVLCELEFI